MRAAAIVQLDNSTPIVLSAEKSVTRGMAGLFGFMKLSFRMGEQYFGAVPKRTRIFVYFVPQWMSPARRGLA